jgi:MFS transporter, DHA1 family, multidrug resistance protein
VGELPLIGAVVGALIGAVIVLFDTHRRAKKVKSGEMKLEEFEPEDRMFLAMIGGVGFPVSTGLYCLGSPQLTIPR